MQQHSRNMVEIVQISLLLNNYSGDSVFCSCFSVFRAFLFRFCCVRFKCVANATRDVSKMKTNALNISYVYSL